MKNIEAQVFDYLNTKGIIKACLLHKLINYLCSPSSKHRIERDDLLACLFRLTRERRIDIIIINSFEIFWKIKPIEQFSYLKDGDYFFRDFRKRKYKTINNFKKSDYIFDSRQLNFKNNFEVEEIFKYLYELIRKKKKIQYKMIIYSNDNSKSLSIFESSKIPFEIKIHKINPPLDLITNEATLFFDLEKQMENIAVIKAFRSKYMCFYITLIDAIHQKIIMLQENNNKSTKSLNEYIKRFGYYCIQFVKSDWVNINHSNPFRWETFFQFFKLPFKILNLEFKSLNFYGRTFNTLAKYRFCIYIKNENKDVISNLKKKGYFEFEDIKDKSFTAIGLDQEIFLPCPSIEYFYFIFKYIFYYQLFLLLHHSFDYIKNYYQDIRISPKEKMLFKIFYPVINELFTISEKKVSEILVFKYYTLNPNELEIIYNNLMINHVRLIETKMMKYFLVKHSICLKC